MPMTSFNDRIRYGPYFYIGALLGMGAVITHTGAGAAIGALMLPVLGLEPGNDFWNFIVLTLLSSVACLMTTNPVQPGLLAPLANQIAAATGWSLESALMMAALGFSNTLLPYAVPPLVVGMQLAGIGLRDAARYTVTLACASMLLLVPLQYLWWRVIGYFG
jgi:di/tricarboxylate transporter